MISALFPFLNIAFLAIYSQPKKKKKAGNNNNNAPLVLAGWPQPLLSKLTY